MVAHLPSKQMVAGSSPVSRSNKSEEGRGKLPRFFLPSAFPVCSSLVKIRLLLDDRDLKHFLPIFDKLPIVWYNPLCS